jgi:hypothetical protein
MTGGLIGLDSPVKPANDGWVGAANDGGMMVLWIRRSIRRMTEESGRRMTGGAVDSPVKPANDRWVRPANDEG